MTVKTFTSNGLWTCPAGVTSVVVECIGGGGGGKHYGGGGGGAYSKKTVSVTPSQVYPITVGAAGIAWHTSGGDSSFSSPSVVMAKGGELGNDNEYTIGTGGQASDSVGDVKYSGGNGYQEFGAGGGSSAGPSSDGNSATSISGAAAVSGGGAGGNGSLSGPSQVGGFPGGGGGGGYVLASPADGAGGLVTITY